MKSLKITTLDRYIIRQFLGTYIFAIAMILVISIVFDVAEKIDDFLADDVSLHDIIFDYYLNFIPYFANLFSPIFVFISVIFFTSKMAGRSEIIAILASGISFRRLLYPYILTATIIFAVSVYLSNFIIPNANDKRLKFEAAYIRTPGYSDTYNVHLQMRPGYFVYIRSYDSDRQTAYSATVESIRNNRLQSKFWANFLVWDSVKQAWTANQWYSRALLPQHDSLQHGADLDTAIFLLPSDLRRSQKAVQTLDYHSLNSYIEQQKLQGVSDINNSLVEKYSRTAAPFATFILSVIGVAVSSRKRRGGTGIHITIGLIISFSYILLMRFAMMFSIGGGLSPLLATWIPNLIFTVVAYALYRLASR